MKRRTKPEPEPDTYVTVRISAYTAENLRRYVGTDTETVGVFLRMAVALALDAEASRYRTK